MQSPSRYYLESRTLSMEIAIIAPRDMSREEHSAGIHQSELKVLRALCDNAQSLPDRDNLLANLKKYEWTDEEHRVIFQAILGLRRADAATLREYLPAAVTRMGFPDITWEDYFAADPGENIQIHEQLRILRDA